MKIIVFGAGKIAKAAVYDLVKNASVSTVIIASRTKSKADAIKRFCKSSKVKTLALDITDKKQVISVMSKADIAMSCVPYMYNCKLTEIAIKTKTHMVDLGGNLGIVKCQLALDKKAKKNDVLVVPDCGLAPGLVSVFTKLFIHELDRVDEVHLRVGGLPQKPTGLLKYGLVFSVKGLVNEYFGKSLELKKGKITKTQTFENLEKIRFGRAFGTLEAFTTSGGTSTLPYTYKGKIKTLDYKTIRYTGHHKVIVDQMGKKDLCTSDTQECRDVLQSFILKNVKPVVKDVILLRCWAIGRKNGRKVKITYTIIDKYDSKTGLTAMMRMTAFPTTALLIEIGSGRIKKRGVVTQENFVNAKNILQELKKRGIKITRSIK